MDPKDGKLLIFTNKDSNHTHIAKFDSQTKQISKPVYQVENHDIQRVTVRNGFVQSYSYTDHFQHTVFLNEEDKKLEKQIKSAFGNQMAKIVSRSNDLKRIVVKTYSDNTPSRYFTIDFATNQAKLWFSQYPMLEGRKLMSKTPVFYSARDKMKLNAYLSMPAEIKDELPRLIVMPHGGPHSRDFRNFDIMTQFFVSKGYAVLQPSFRGSSGFGLKYEKAGYKQWGKAMHNDVMDALEWVIKQGKIDADKVCMVGASYGGYETLVASYKNPENFKCFVSIAGISDLQKSLDTDSDWSNVYGASNDMTVGSSEDYKDIQKNSPINYVDKMNKPLLLIHGTNDTVVRYEQSEAIYKALKKKRKPVKYIELEDGTHYLGYQKNRKIAFQSIGDFLEEHLR